MRFLCLAVLQAVTQADPSQSDPVQVVTFFLKQAGAATIVEKALAVSDPTSEDYGAFLSFEEVVALQRPPQGYLQKMLVYLDSIGVKDRHVSLAGDKVTAAMPAGQASNFALAELEAVLDGVMAPNAGWEFLSPVQRHPQNHSGLTRQLALPLGDGPAACLSPLSGVTPTCLRSAYGIGDARASHPDNLQAVIVNEPYESSDLEKFLAKYKLPKQTVAKNVNGEPTGTPGVEASLDMEYIISMGSGTPTWWFHLDGAASNPFAAWLTYMSNTKAIPWVQSLSVGAAENEVGNSLVARMNTEMAALGARGVTIVFASGDSGYKPAQKFGAASPFVTAVGGVWRGEGGDDSYLSVDEISTGGFSSLEANAAPKWQTAAISAFMKTSGRRGKVDPSKRCVPDFSLYDDGLQIEINGALKGEGGTSCSAPVASGMFSLINDALLKAGHTTLGMVNPLLYANEDAFLDITHGNNGLGGEGFDAVEGYDPASGLGTFDVDTFEKLKKAAIAAKEAAVAKRSRSSVAKVIV